VLGRCRRRGSLRTVIAAFSPQVIGDGLLRHMDTVVSPIMRPVPLPRFLTCNHVNCLLGIWPQFIAKRLKIKDATKEVRSLLQRLTVDQLFNPKLWPDLSFFALIQPDGVVLPVRTQYGDTGETNIGLNPFTSKEPIWYAGPDLAASVLLSPHRPNIIKAIKMVPSGTQEGIVSHRPWRSHHQSGS
jgi:hypothetical protein